MPLFSSHPSTVNQAAVANGQMKSELDSKNGSNSGKLGRPGSIMSRIREMSSSDSSPRSADPTIKAARQKVVDAENAEKDADRALELARRAVEEAHQHVKNLEVAALEGSRLARAKQLEAKTIRKVVNRLGRHDRT